MNTNIGIDLGSYTTRIFTGRAIALSEASIATVEVDTWKPTHFGDAAYPMMGRTSERMKTVMPIERGVIADYGVTEQMIRYFLKKVNISNMLKPKIMIAMPAGVTVVQQRNIKSAAESAGARNVCLIESPVAAAIGVGLDFAVPHGAIIVDVGAGTTDIGVLSMGGLSECESVKIASMDFDEAIIRYVRKEKNILIGRLTAEYIKKEIGSVIHRPIEITMHAKGRNLLNGLPEAFEISSNEISKALQDPAFSICKSIQVVLEHTAPELVGDISEDGILLCGGGALIHGMADLIERYIGIKATLVHEPVTCVARGIGKALDNFALLQNGDYEFRSLQDLIID